MVFSLPSLTPPPPGLAKDHKKYGFFFRHPSLSETVTFQININGIVEDVAFFVDAVSEGIHIHVFSDVFKNLQQLQHIDFYNNPKLLALSYHHSPLSAALWYH